VTFPITLNVTGDLHVHVLDPSTITQPILDALTHLGATVSEPLATIDDALNALQAKVADLTNAEAADRAAFDALAAAVRAFLAALPPAGGALTDTQIAQANSILASLDTATAGETQEAADEATLQAEVPAEPAA